MIDKYFFIPASNNHFISKVDNINAEYIVFDLEDAIETSSLNSAIKNLSELKIRDNYFIRFPFNKKYADELNKVLRIGFKNYIVPKISSESEFENIILNHDNFQFYKIIILVENPLLLINLNEFVKKFKNILKGIGVGSHDYSATMNMQHDFSNLYFARQFILNVAKAYNIDAIDMVSMDLNDSEKLKKEYLSTVRMGFDGKFFIHPNQLNVFNKVKFYSDEETEEAETVLSLINNKKDFSAFKYNGKVFEKLHIQRLQRIMEWKKSYERI